MRRLLVIFLILFLIGCTAAGDRLSGSAIHRDPAIAYPSSLDSIRIGGTTKDEVRNLLGAPTDIQRSSDATGTRESWAYAHADPAIHPLQYVLGVGAFALSDQQRQPSFSISFSSDELVDGVAVRDIQPFGESGASTIALGTVSEVSPYGTNNPLTRHARHDAFAGSGISGE